MAGAQLKKYTNFEDHFERVAGKKIRLAEKAANSQIEILDKELDSNERMLGEVKSLQKDLAGIQRLLEQKINADDKLDQLFKEVVVSFKKVHGNRALTERQAIVEEQKMLALTREVIKLEEKIEEIEKDEYNNIKKLSALSQHARIVSTRLRRISNDAKKFGNRMKKQSKQVSDWALSIYNVVSHNNAVGYANKTQKQRDRYSKLARNTARRGIGGFFGFKK